MDSTTAVSLKAAIVWTERGYSVAPLYERLTDESCSCHFKKLCPFPPFHPRTSIRKPDWASTDPATIKGWLMEWPSAVVGIRTGGDDGVVAIICASAAEAAELSKHGELVTPLPALASGELVFLYRSDKPLESTTCVAALSGVRFCGELGWFVAPDIAGIPEGFNVKSIPPLPPWIEELVDPGAHVHDESAKFPTVAFPLPIQDFIREVAESNSCAEEQIGLAALTVSASAIGSSRTLEVKTGYEEHSSIYAIVVAPPGSGKSPCMKLAARPMSDAQSKLKDRFLAESALYKQACREHHAQVLNWKDARRRFSRDQGSDPGIEPEAPEKPALAQLFTTDATIEAVMTLLHQNPGGILCLLDEAKAWLRSRSITHWLSLWSSSPTIVNRKTEEEPLVVENPVISVLANLTPASLEQFQKSLDKPDGFFDRVLFAFVEDRPKKGFSKASVQRSTQEGYRVIYERLLSLRETTKILQFTAAAFDEYALWADEHRNQIYHPGVASNLRGILVKLEGYCARFALILHLCRMAANETDSEEIDVESVRCAIRLTEYFRRQAKKVYRQVGARRHEDKLMSVVKWIRKKGASARLRTLQNNNVGGIKSKTDARALAMELVNGGYGYLNPKNGSTEFHLYPEYSGD